MESRGSLGLGLDVGSTNVKACLVQDGRVVWAEVRAHDGDPRGTAQALLRDRGVAPGTPALATGQEGRRQFRLRSVIAPVALERALAALGASAGAVVSVGGEDLVVYTVDAQGRIVNTCAGNKCASGTGEYFAQQLKRMDLGLDAASRPEVARAKVVRLSARCSVFMKSDCTHKLNKGEADKHDIVLSLGHLMARKVLEFLGKAKIAGGRVVLVGGAIQNPHLVRFVREGLPAVELVVPAEAPWFEAFGAAHLAQAQGEPLPPPERLVTGSESSFARGEPLAQARDRVTFAASRRGALRPGRSYVLGVDGGSTTTKVALVDPETQEIVASHYGRTLGDPVAALKRCLAAVRDEVRAALGEDANVPIHLCATTGSSRELLGVFCETPAIYNEIIAHTAGTTYFDPAIDTIFEIGGQDAKYVHLRNRVPVDYAMNEACSAGTGSFLEESAAGDLDIRRAEEIGPIALAATAPLRFGEHCSAFINSDIRKAVQQGASRADIVAGLVLSIVANYLNRVVGNRRIGDHIVLQGGVAKNPAVPLAFASLLGKHIVIPPDPELMGCFGVARLAAQKLASGELAAGSWTLDDLLERQVAYEKVFRCRACDNECPIQMLRVAGRRYPFGGRCNKYANQRHRAKAATVVDYVEVRRRLYFETHAPAPRPAGPGVLTVGVPETFSVHSLWPLYAHFFDALGVRVELCAKLDEAGAAKCESAYCYPAEIAHGVTETLRHTAADFWFLPHFKAMPSYEDDVHACLCPIMQGLPYYLRTALALDDAKILRPVLDLTHGMAAGTEEMAAVAARLGCSRDEGRRAYAQAVARQEACYREGRRIGAKALAEAERAQRPVIVLCGRPYNAMTAMANMGIPRKFTTRGYTILPFDFLPVDDEEIMPNQYWYYGQQNLKAAVQVKKHPNAFACFVTNFSCAPDSFILHYLRWISNTKPFLVLELDSHTADAGLDTRIEAFLDIIEGYRRAQVSEEPMMVERDWDVVLEGTTAHVVNRRTHERLGLKDRRVQLIWPSMGALATQLVSNIARSNGVDSVALKPADVRTAARARAVASGKECIPALLVLGAFLEYFAENRLDPNRVYLLFMPLTTGPCRTGQYAVFYQLLFQELGYRNVVVLSLNSDNSYAELGAEFNQRTWIAIVLADYMRDVADTLRALAVDWSAAKQVVDAVSAEMVAAAALGPAALLADLPGWARRLGRIALRKPLAEARRVLVVGEIFVRRDDYSVETLVAHLADRQIVPKITSLSEWVHYLDWDQVRRFRRRLAALPLRERALAPELRKLLWLHVEMVWKAYQERRIRQALRASGLVPDSPHGMNRIMGRSAAFTTPELESEASLSPCVASVGVDEGYDGIAIIAPFACLPGRLIEAITVPWARARGIPVIAIENDGNPYPPNVVSRLEIFAHNVGRGIRGAAVHWATPAAAAATAVAAAGNGHGNGHGHARGHGHGRGNGHGHARGHGDGRGNGHDRPRLRLPLDYLTALGGWLRGRLGEIATRPRE
ncbi:MAG TPA: acyl-CoA dehydratase activase [Polyangia bacterium]